MSLKVLGWVNESGTSSMCTKPWVGRQFDDVWCTICAQYKVWKYDICESLSAVSIVINAYSYLFCHVCLIEDYGVCILRSAMISHCHKRPRPRSIMRRWLRLQGHHKKMQWVFVRLVLSSKCREPVVLWCPSLACLGQWKDKWQACQKNPRENEKWLWSELKTLNSASTIVQTMLVCVFRISNVTQGLDPIHMPERGRCYPCSSVKLIKASIVSLLGVLM